MTLNLGSKSDWNKSAADAMRDESYAASTGRSSSGDQTTTGSLRKERGAIAAQACDTCRSRKQRCDEQRPKCGTCQKFRLECNYREPQPTKKDRTLMEILDRIKGLENKIDNLNIKGSFQSGIYNSMPDRVSSGPASASMTMSPGIGETQPTTPFQVPDPRAVEPHSTITGAKDGYVYASSVAQMMAWPAMRRILEPIKDRVPGFNPATIERDGPSIVLGIHEHFQTAPLSCQTKTPEPMSTRIPSWTLENLTWEGMERLSKSYFDTFNYLFPLVDRHAFNSETMPSLVRDALNESMASTIALLVFALGELAISGSEGIPLRAYNGRAGGLKGGTIMEAPGLVLFNEARKRIGFNLTECSIENIQAFALAGIYYGACGHPKEQWRMTTCASMGVEALIASKPSELSSPRGDLVRRAFWHCSMMETCIILELGMPTTAVEKLEQVVGLPDFRESLAEEDYIGNQSTHFQEHFASQIVLRRLTMDVHMAMDSGPSSSPSPQPVGSPRYTSLRSSPSPGRPPHTTDLATIGRHARLLEQWRGLLPVPLRWQEDSPGAFAAQNPVQEPHHKPGFPLSPTAATPHHLQPLASPSAIRHRSVPDGYQEGAPQMFTTDLDAPPVPYPMAYDIQVALLRTRYYYAKYLLYRPILYKALHYPDSMTADDASGAAACLRAALKWPVTMSPACARKGLIPCLYIWTQNVFGVLLVLFQTRTDPMLRRIVAEGLCGDAWERDAAETARLYIDWLRDLSAVDPAAAFAWQVVKALYGLEDTSGFG